MNDALTPLGKMTAFYIPAHKLDAPAGEQGPTPRSTIHQFLIEHFRAYTHSPSLVKGFWLDERSESTRLNSSHYSRSRMPSSA